MGMVAASAYLQTLREGRKVSRAKLAAQLGVSEMSIWRIEEEGQEPKAEFFMALVKALGGDPNHLLRLLTEDATQEEGERLARTVLQAQDRQIGELVAASSDAELDYVLAQLREEAVQDTSFLGFLRRLVGSRRDDGAPGPSTSR
jgi:transcriptional regulator with XRE-family HTH domain